MAVSGLLGTNAYCNAVIAGLFIGCLAAFWRTYRARRFMLTSFSLNVVSGVAAAFLGAYVAVILVGLWYVYLTGSNFGLTQFKITSALLTSIVGAVLAVSTYPAIERRWQAKRWSRLSEQFFRVDKWSVCRG
jgi:hypothetical protein